MNIQLTTTSQFSRGNT